MVGVIVAVIALSLGTIAASVTVPVTRVVAGVVEPMTGVSQIVSPTGATVTSIAVKPGDTVTAGQVLLEISSERFGPAGSQSETARTALKSQLDEVTKQLAATRSTRESKKQAARDRASLIERQRSQLARDIASAYEGLALSEAALAQQETLVKQGYYPKLQLLQGQLAHRDRRAAISSDEQRLMEMESQLASTERDLELIDQETELARLALQREVHDLERSLAQEAIAGRQSVGASRAGVVAAVRAQPGQSVRVGESLVDLYDPASALVAKLHIPVDAIGHVHEGAEIELRFRNYEYQDYGIGRAVLTRLDATPLLGAASDGATVSAPVYVALARMDQLPRSTTGEPVEVLPGMEFDAHVVVARASLLAWLVGRE